VKVRTYTHTHTHTHKPHTRNTPTHTLSQAHTKHTVSQHTHRPTHTHTPTHTPTHTHLSRSPFSNRFFSHSITPAGVQRDKKKIPSHFRTLSYLLQRSHSPPARTLSPVGP